MVDVDGVLIAHPDARGWSATLDHDLGISIAALQQAFFDVHWGDVVHGRAALRERLAPVLAELSPSVTCDRLIDYWFSNDAHLDRRLFDELRSLRREGVETHLATVQEHERSDDLWAGFDLRSSFDGMHYAAALGCSKPAAAFYRAVEAAADLPPQAIFFIDDKAANVAGARDCDWTAAVWTGQDSVRHLIDSQLWSGS